MKTPTNIKPYAQLSRLLGYINQQSKREWVSLTEGEIIDADLYTMRTRGDSYAFARAIEAKLKEKNGV